jgi:hypothetical protein
MPEVAGQKFNYTPEGIAAAESAAEVGTSADAMLDELVSVLPEEGDDLSVEEAVQEPEPEQPEDVQMPSDEIIVDLFESIYGEEMDESEQAQEQFQDLKELLAEMPELAAAIAAGEISPSEAAIMIFREAANTA